VIILDAVNRGIGGTGQQSVFNLLDEQRLALDLVQRPVLDAVAVGYEGNDLGGCFGDIPGDECCKVIGLPQGQLAASGSYFKFQTSFPELIRLKSAFDVSLVRYLYQ